MMIRTDRHLIVLSLMGLLGGGCGDDATGFENDASSLPGDSRVDDATVDGSLGQDADAGPVEDGPACGNAAAEALPIQIIAPRQTDEGIRSGDPDHAYVEAVGEPTGRLLLFLPGATASPSDYQDILRHAAASGDDALGLAYVNDERIFVVCSRSDRPDCQETIRLEILRGEDLSPEVEVDAANSILNRLVMALQHVGWTQYLDGEEPRWDRIAVAGHSQGSGHAAMIGRFYSTDRVIVFAGTEPAPWTRQPRMTPPERTWAFAHTGDPLFNAFPNSWANLRIPGAPTIIDGLAPPFDGAHQLISEAAANPDDENFHRSPISDTATPRETSGAPVYGAVWCHLLGHGPVN
ncbi:MAG: hypothetical protein AAGF12_43395 [Myxococcota bacterium]